MEVKVLGRVKLKLSSHLFVVDNTVREEGDLTWGGDHTTECTGDALQSCTPETYIMC